MRWDSLSSQLLSKNNKLKIYKIWESAMVISTQRGHIQLEAKVGTELLYLFNFKMRLNNLRLRPNNFKLISLYI
ncbi:hypothetical protein C0J52_27886 [Blattella germanica]|nr:hypothetical protein C0J52_27886 [Blattella germanica]